MKLGVWEQLATQGVLRWQVHKRVAGGSQHSVGCYGIRRVNMQAYSFGSLLAQITALRRGAFGERNAPTSGWCIIAPYPRTRIERTSILSVESSASCGVSFSVSRRKLPDRECFVTSFRQGSYTPLHRLCGYPLCTCRPQTVLRTVRRQQVAKKV